MSAVPGLPAEWRSCGVRRSGAGAGKWTNLDDDDFGLGVGARYYVTEALSVGGRIESIDDEDTLAVGVRFQF